MSCRICSRALRASPSASISVATATRGLPRWTTAPNRPLSTSFAPRKNPDFERPGPPPLPAKEQREFEKLVKQKQNLSPFSSNTSMDADELHPDVRRKPDPDFEGETNPTTGEVGGPKKDPLSWQREWTYGGRATDF